MLFKVTHIDVAGHRHKARVLAANPTDAMEQMDRVFGEARGGACVRLKVKPVLHVVSAKQGAQRRTA